MGGAGVSGAGGPATGESEVATGGAELVSGGAEVGGCEGGVPLTEHTSNSFLLVGPFVYFTELYHEPFCTEGHRETAVLQDDAGRCSCWRS